MIDCLYCMIVNVYIFYDINLIENSRECVMVFKECIVDYCILYYGYMFEYFDNNDGM